MLASSTEQSTRFTRGDAGRLIGSSLLLIVAMAAILGFDLLPAQPQLEVGKPAPANVQATRTTQYVSKVLTEEARAAARTAVDPQYDFTLANAVAVATQQLGEFERLLTSVDLAFDDKVSSTTKAALLAAALPDQIGTEDRATLLALDGARWAAVRSEAARVLDTLERSELRDVEVAAVRSTLAGRMGGDLNAAEAALAATLIRPLVVANSTFSTTLTDQARDRAAESVVDQTKSWSAARPSSAAVTSSTTSPWRRWTGSTSTRADSTLSGSLASCC